MGLANGAALLVGVEHDDRPEYANTARLLHRLLVDPTLTGLEDGHARLLAGSVSKDVVMTALHQLVENDPEWVFVYVGSHGNTDGSLVMSTTGSLHLADLLAPVAGRTACAFVDSCFSAEALNSVRNVTERGVDLASMGLSGEAEGHARLFVATSSRGEEESRLKTMMVLGPLGFLPLTPFGLHLVEALLGAASGDAPLVFTDDVERWIDGRVPETTGGTQRPVFLRPRTPIPLSLNLGKGRKDWSVEARKILNAIPSGIADLAPLPLPIPPPQNLLVTLARDVLRRIVPTHRLLRFPASTKIPAKHYVRASIGAAIHRSVLEYHAAQTLTWLGRVDDPAVLHAATRALRRLPARSAYVRARLLLFRGLHHLGVRHLDQALEDVTEACIADDTVAAAWFYRAVAEGLHVCENASRTTPDERALMLRGALQHIDRAQALLTEQAWWERFWPPPKGSDRDPTIDTTKAILYLLIAANGGECVALNGEAHDPPLKFLERSNDLLTQALHPQPNPPVGYESWRPKEDARFLAGAVSVAQRQWADRREPATFEDAFADESPADETWAENAFGPAYLAALATLNAPDTDAKQLLEAEAVFLAGCERPDFGVASRLALGCLYFRRRLLGAAKLLFTTLEERLRLDNTRLVGHEWDPDWGACVYYRAASHRGLRTHQDSIEGDLTRARKYGFADDSAVEELLPPRGPTRR